MTPDLYRIQKLHAALVIIMAGLATTIGLSSGWSMLLGGTVVGVNFWILRRFFGYVLGPDWAKRAGTVVALGLAKQVLFVGLLGLLFWRVDLDAIAFAAGVTLLLVACVAVSVERQPITA